MFKKAFTASSLEGRPEAPKYLWDAIKLSTPRAISLWLSQTDHERRDDQLRQLDDEQAVALSYLLSPETAEELLDTVSPHSALDFLRQIELPRAAALLDSLDTDDAARIIEQ